MLLPRGHLPDRNDAATRAQGDGKAGFAASISEAEEDSSARASFDLGLHRICEFAEGWKCPVLEVRLQLAVIGRTKARPIC